MPDCADKNRLYYPITPIHNLPKCGDCGAKLSCVAWGSNDRTYVIHLDDKVFCPNCDVMADVHAVREGRTWDAKTNLDRAYKFHYFSPNSWRYYRLTDCPYKIEKTEEAGYRSALLGISFSYGVKDINKMPGVALGLSPKDGGHNKFLEEIQVWFDITLQRGLWQQFDTYRAGVSKQSESTMHTGLKKPLTQENFYQPIYQPTLEHLNALIEAKDLESFKNELPEGFLQRRMVNINYKTLRNIFLQRYDHKWSVWKHVCFGMMVQLDHPELLECSLI